MFPSAKRKEFNIDVWGLPALAVICSAAQKHEKHQNLLQALKNEQVKVVALSLRRFSNEKHPNVKNKARVDWVAELQISDIKAHNMHVRFHADKNKALAYA